MTAVTLTDEQLGAFLSDMTEIDEEWLKSCWGFSETWDKGAKVMKLPYDSDWPGKFSSPEWRCATRELLIDSRLYFRDKHGKLNSYRTVELTRGRFFGWMWSQGMLPKGYTSSVEDVPDVEPDTTLDNPQGLDDELLRLLGE